MKNNSKRIILGISIAVLIIFGLLVFNFSQSNESSNNFGTNELTRETNYTASFAIYTNGTFRVFTSPMYHDLSPDVFIKIQNPNIIQVKKPNLTWRDFFNTLPFELNETCLTTGTQETFCTNETHKLQFYLNGSLNQNALNQTIYPNDKLLVTYDTPNSRNLTQQLQSIPDTN